MRRTALVRWSWSDGVSAHARCRSRSNLGCGRCRRACGHRAPANERERVAIVRALPAYLKTVTASSCVSFVVRVSNNRSYAKVRP
jgi:hypothetical protein